MKDSYFLRQFFLIIQQAAAAAFLCAMEGCGNVIGREHYIHFLIVSIFFMDAAYISYKNIRNSRTLNHFTFILLLSGWQFLLSLYASFPLAGAVSKLLLPFALCQSVYFVQLFVFQAAAYKYQKGLLAVIRVTCIASTAGFFLSQQAFALTYMVQLFFSAAAVLFAGLIHRRRVLFVLKSHKKNLLLSFCIIVLPFISYVAVFYRKTGYLDNMGSYLIVMLAFFSIHSIVFQNRPQQEHFLALTRKNSMLLILLSAAFLGIAAYSLNMPFINVLVFIHCVILSAMLFNLILYRQISREKEGCRSGRYRHFYEYTLEQIRREEDLKKGFSNYLHDNILQDLLSVKNLINKAEQPEIRSLISEILGNLNSSIRKQMQAYHPVLLKNLTLKENIQNLLDSLAENHSVNIHLDCEDTVFLAAPYDMLVCRMISELVSNALKHSNAKNIRISLVQVSSCISLTAEDNGTGFEPHSYHRPGHRGLDSIKEQVSLLDGTAQIESSPGAGTRVTVTLPMKGADSYEAFIAR